MIAFVPVDASGKPIEESPGYLRHYFFSSSSWSGYQVFASDPHAASGSDSQGTGIFNAGLTLPSGDYYVVVYPARALPGHAQVDYVSPIFEHSYYENACTDFFTGDSVSCVVYELRLHGADFPSRPSGGLKSSMIRDLPLKAVTDGDLSPPGRISAWVPE
ncbi:MAG: hypothetical protein QM778_12820 [Myxococcales bacterium]